MLWCRILLCSERYQEAQAEQRTLLDVLEVVLVEPPKKWKKRNKTEQKDVRWPRAFQMFQVEAANLPWLRC